MLSCRCGVVVMLLSCRCHVVVLSLRGNEGCHLRATVLLIFIACTEKIQSVTRVYFYIVAFVQT